VQRARPVDLQHLLDLEVDDLLRPRQELRACQGPGCVLFFIRDRRREWCSHGCGNRARAARHYARARQS
jgi:predicted RNA-binding Zn ribbon-like protein